MQVKDYIDQTIIKLFDNFPNLSECGYLYDDCSDTHFIKIPSSNIYESEAFNKFDAEVSIAFMDSNFSGSLCFLSDDSAINYGEFKVIRNSYIELSERLKNFEFNSEFNLNNSGFNFKSSFPVFPGSYYGSDLFNEDYFPLAA